VSALALARPRESYFERKLVCNARDASHQNTHTQLGGGSRHTQTSNTPPAARRPEAERPEAAPPSADGPCGVIIAAPLDRSSSVCFEAEMKSFIPAHGRTADIMTGTDQQ
jgi:hypothetical protein